MAGQKGEGLKPDDYWVVLLAALVAVVLLWLVFGARAVALLGWMRKYELLIFAPMSPNAGELQSKLVQLNGRYLTFVESVAMLSKTGIYVRWLYIPVLAVMSYVVYVKGFRFRYTKQHSMTSLAKQEAKLWPEIAPVAGKQKELVSGDTRKGPWAVSMTEWEYADMHKLAERGGALDRARTREVFTQQLGPLWVSPEALPIHARALYAAFLLRICDDNEDPKLRSKASMEAFRKLSRSFAEGGGDPKKMDTAWVAPTIAKYKNHPSIKRVHAQHAYVFTVMATLQQIARADGVLASAMYLWLKPTDRRLWYTLNNVGRYAFHIECAGIMSHWLFEKTVGMAAPSPMLESAINGLDEALKDYSEDDRLDLLYK